MSPRVVLARGLTHIFEETTMHPDTNLYRIICEPLAPGLNTIVGVVEFAGMALTGEGHELRFRGTEPLTEVTR
ncbi:hypothetical protein [Kocuria sp.]|uniref:hypothetical protein n=1 Tax=Kocuria sp. TaxID=1871328 RepID=UPI0026DBE285|nr:hypothetical protein [Kocuria sp.]MDO4919912.1 hypothetical protein [Kocuria sp.]